MPTYSCQLVVLLVYLVLLLLQEFALRTLISCILAYKTETAIHLRERFGREDKHKLVLNAAVARHIAHRVDKTRAALAQLALQRLQLTFQNVDIAINSLYVCSDVVDGFLLLSNLRIERKNLLEAAVYVFLLYFKFLLVLRNFFLYLLILLLQAFYFFGSNILYLLFTALLKLFLRCCSFLLLHILARFLLVCLLFIGLLLSSLLLFSLLLCRLLLTCLLLFRLFLGRLLLLYLLFFSLFLARLTLAYLLLFCLFLGRLLLGSFFCCGLFLCNLLFCFLLSCSLFVLLRVGTRKASGQH